MGANLLVFISSMVVNNFNVKRIFALPAEAEPPLVIDSDAVPAFAVLVKPVAGSAGIPEQHLRELFRSP